MSLFSFFNSLTPQEANLPNSGTLEKIIEKIFLNLMISKLSNLHV